MKTISKNDKEIEEKIKSLEKLDLIKHCTLPQLSKDILDKYKLVNMWFLKQIQISPHIIIKQ